MRDMGDSLRDRRVSGHHVLPDSAQGHMAKAAVREPDTTLLELMGAAVQRAILEVFESNKVAAATLGMDDAELGKQMNGTRRIQFDKLLAYGPLREPLLCALSEMFGARITRRIEFPADRWNGTERRRA